MFGWEWKHDGVVHLVWIAVAIVVALVIAELRARDALARFLSPAMQARLAIRSTRARAFARLGLFGVALVCGVLALMRPQTKGKIVEDVKLGGASVDVMVVLDVSRSMLAADVEPNRLARAKFEIKKMAEKLVGGRVGLIAFAGRAAMMCPLTTDRAFFDLAVDGVDTRSVSRGGTRIGDALRTAIKAFPEGSGAKLVVLITDGEDHDSFPLDAAEAAKKAGVHVVAVGLGSEAGAPIFIVDPQTGAKTEVMQDGQPVITKLDGETLRKIALTTEGAYVPAGTSALDLEAILKEHVTPIANRAVDAARATRVIRGERYVWFVLASLVALVIALWLGATTGPGRRAAVGRMGEP